MLNLEKNTLTADRDTFFSMALEIRKTCIHYNQMEREVRLDIGRYVETLRVGKEYRV